MSQTTLSVRIDGEDKRRFEEFCSNTGMNVSTAINMFIKNVNMFHKLPFTVEWDAPNAATLAAFAEGERMAADPNSPRFSSVDELFTELES